MWRSKQAEADDFRDVCVYLLSLTPLLYVCMYVGGKPRSRDRGRMGLYVWSAQQWNVRALPVLSVNVHVQLVLNMATKLGLVWAPQVIFPFSKLNIHIHPLTSLEPPIQV